MGFGGNFLCFLKLLEMNALMNEEMKIRCQNGDKFVFCG